nr:S8 family serine peptidase [uncultured Pseudomonas sp.]
MNLDIEILYYRNFSFDGKFHLRCIGPDLDKIKRIHYVLRVIGAHGPKRLDAATARSQVDSGLLVDHGCPSMLGTALRHGRFEISARITLTDEQVIELELPGDADATVVWPTMVIDIQPDEADRRILDRVPLTQASPRGKRAAAPADTEARAVEDPLSIELIGLPDGATDKALPPLLIKFGNNGFACFVADLEPDSGSSLARLWPNLKQVIQLQPVLAAADRDSDALAVLRDYYLLEQPASMLNDTFVALLRTLAAQDYVESLSLLPTEQDPGNLLLAGLAGLVATLLTGLAVAAGNDAYDESLPTPDFEALQTYLDAPTAVHKGMNIRSVWSKQVTGKGARVHFADGGLFAGHEDLRATERLHVISDQPNEDPAHGTASVGLLFAQANAFGMKGICHDCELYLYDNRAIDTRKYNRTPADLLRHVRAGDIVAINRQSANIKVLSTFLPSLHERDWWDMCNALTARGAIVLNAASNGSSKSLPDKGTSRGQGVNLSQWPYFNDHGDAGAILVGACQSWDGKPHQYSNYGYRYRMLNAWGDSVATLGYGKLQDKPGDDRDYTNSYGGTSSATPLVTGALSLIQSYAMRRHHVYLDADQMHLLVMATGYADATLPLTDVLPMGRRPDVGAALALLDRILGGGAFKAHDEL